MPESLLLQDDITDYESDYESSIKSDIEVDLYDTVDAVESVSTRLKVRSTNSEETTSDWTYDPSESRYMLVQERIGIPQIRETQARVLSLLLAGKSVLLLARTGWGKSLIFQGLIHMMPADSRRYITIIFVPLSGLAQEQVAELNERGRKLGATTDEAIFYDKTKLADRHLDDIKQGRYKWVFLSPEKALHLGVFKQLWENSDFRSKVLLLAVDEAHLVSEWGKGFREAYSQLGRIRNIFDTTVPWFITSATMPLNMRKEVMGIVGISKYEAVITDLDRPNLYYNIMVTDMSSVYGGEGRSPLDFVLDEVQKTEDPRSIHKTILYFDSPRQCRAYVKRLRKILPSKLQHLTHQLIQPYYAERADEDKNLSRQFFLTGECRVICATEAFGMGMNVKDIIWVFQINPPRNMAQLMQRFGRAARDPALRAVCTLVLSKNWRGISAEAGHVPKNQVQRHLKWGTRSELYNWITAPCLRKAFLQFLAVPEQFSVFPKGTCCCRCSERDRDEELIFPAIGYEGLCDIELEASRIQATKAAHKEARKWKTPGKLRDRVMQELELWKIRVMSKMDWNGLFIPEMLIPDDIVKKIASNARRITCTPIPMQQLINWGSYKPFVLDNSEETIESLLERVWQEMKDEVEKDEADAKAIKKKKAGETRAANKAKRNESAGSATSSDASPARRGRGRPRKNSIARSPSPYIPLSPLKRGRGRPGKNSQIDIQENSAAAGAQSRIPRPLQCAGLQRASLSTSSNQTDIPENPAVAGAKSRIPRPLPCAKLQRATQRASSNEINILENSAAGLEAKSRIPRPLQCVELRRTTQRASSRLSQVQNTAE